MQTNPLISSAANGGNLSEVEIAKDTTSAAALSQDFETFLQMLTVQLENQDPLNPVEASDYAVQLATFSGVEQQVKTNELLSSLAEQMSLQNLGQYANWIGHQIRHSGPVTFDGNPIQIVANFQSGADTAQLVIRDSSGREVQRSNLTASGDTSWDGIDDQGVALQSGRYLLLVESFANGQSLGAEPVETYATVLETRTSNSDTNIVLTDGSVISPSQITALR